VMIVSFIVLIRINTVHQTGMDMPGALRESVPIGRPTVTIADRGVPSRITVQQYRERERDTAGAKRRNHIGIECRYSWCGSVSFPAFAEEYGSELSGNSGDSDTTTTVSRESDI